MDEIILIRDRDDALLGALLDVWEGSVRATHHFLSEGDIVALRPEVRAGIAEVEALYGCREEGGAWLGFIGVQQGMVEMLFVGAQARGRGVGKRLLTYAVERLGATRVDVNEQNPEAAGFYRHMGFKVVGRDALDGQGRPFPILHMRL